MMKRLSIVLLAGLLVAGCDLDLNDPNLPTTEDVLTSREGISQLAVGLQAAYSGQLNDLVYVPGLLTDEIGAGGATFEVYQNLDSKTPDPALSQRDPAEAPWSGMYYVIEEANNLLDNAEDVGFGPGTTSGLLALGEVYKGMALGHIAEFYEAAPIETGLDIPEPQFVPREQVMSTAIGLLQSALSRIQSTAPSDAFNNEIVAAGFDLANTARAMIARYALVAGDYDLAMQSAQQVNANVLSIFGFSGSDPNPLYGMWYSSGNAYKMLAEDSFRLAAEAGDQRVGYWVQEADIQGASVPLDDLPRFMTPGAPFHAYLPDEMKLIMAEVMVRRDSNLSGALELVNQVRTQCESALDEPVACLPALALADVPTAQDMLAQILYERRYELYLQGVSWSDYRRFGVSLPDIYLYMPTPFSECERNDNATNC
jgi:hypothetical protein